MKNKSKIMKVLTVKQPWAYLICSGIKDIENRSWKLPEKYKGERVLIHASAKADDIKLAIDGQATVEEIQLLSALNYCDENELYSAIIGSVRFVDCTFNHHSIWAEKSEGIATGGHVINVNKPIIWNWVVADPVLFDKPIRNVKGKLSFWDYDLPEEYETILKL